MIFHITISCFMSMKYWCDKNRLYLMPIAFAFASSALLMLGTLSSYPGWLLCNSEYIVKQNDALIFYSFRNILMAVLFITAIIIYRFRQHLNQSCWRTCYNTDGMLSIQCRHSYFILATLQ